MNCDICGKDTNGNGYTDGDIVYCEECYDKKEE